jgi:tripartite ATP-independent transporter DctM subunit
MTTLTVATLLLVLLLVLLVCGVWIAVALAAVAWAGFAVLHVEPAGSEPVQAFWGSSANWTIAALPLFVWMGEILFRTRLSEEMFEGLAPWLGWLPGRLMHVNVLACGIFGTVSGSSAATCATIAKVALPELIRRGYDEKTCLGSLCGAGTLGILLPPSIIMVVYAVAAEVSILKVFLAGFLPGFLLMALFSGYIVVWALLHPDRTPREGTRLSLREKLYRSRLLIPCLALIVFIIWVMVAGWATATESAAYGVLGALAIAHWSGGLNRVTFWQSLMGATRLSCMIMFILAGASFLSTCMAFTGIPRALAAWVASLDPNPHALIAILALIYIVLGTALDGISMIVLTTSIVIPMVTAAGFDLVWFGIFIVLLVEIAELTPPLGFNLFVLQTMSGRDSNYVAWASLPFFGLMVLAIALITVFSRHRDLASRGRPAPVARSARVGCLCALTSG